MKKKTILLLGLICVLSINSLTGFSQDKVSIVVDANNDRRVEYALGKLEAVLKEKGLVTERIENVSGNKADGKYAIIPKPVKNSCCLIL